MSNAPGLFFTGTDTGVGKTFVTAAVARILRRQGQEVTVSKPVATGASWRAGRWLADDTLRLAEAAGLNSELERVTRWSFPDPVAPPVAARRQGMVLTLSEIAREVREQRRPGKMLLVEGVGGLLCPLTEHETIAELAGALGIALVVIARQSLGTLNHTLLTLEAARSRQLPVAGVVVNETVPARGRAAETNVLELQIRIDVPVLAVVSYREDPFHGEPPALAEVDWRRLGGADPL